MKPSKGSGANAAGPASEMKKKEGHGTMKRFLASILACAVTAAALVGCGGGASSSAAAPGSSPASGDGKTVGTATSVSWWMDPQNLSSNQCKSFGDSFGWQAYEKNVGVDIEWQEPASGQSAEQFNLIIATNDLPDIMYYSWGAYPGGPDAAINDGKIVALNDYIEQYAPNLNAYLNAHPDIKKEVTTDSGNIYCFPGVYTYTSQDSDVWQDTIDREPYAESFIGLVVRKDLLDKAGLDVPVTVDDWYEALKAFKDMGIKYPMSCQATFLTLAQSFATAYDITVPVVGMDMGSSPAFVVQEDGTIAYGPAQDGYREYLSFLNKLYAEGLLDPDFMVQDRTTEQSKILNGEVGAWVEMMPAGLGNLRNQILAEDPDAEFYPIGVLNPVAEEGQKLIYKQGNAPYIGSGAAITTSCEDIATACKVLDYGWSEEGNRLLNWGIEGESYEFVDGWPKLTDQIIHNDLGLAPSEAFSRYRNLNGPYPMDHTQRLESKRDYTLQEGNVDENLKSLDLWSSSENGTVRAGLPSTTMLTEEASQYANAYNELSTYVSEMFAKFVMGNEPLDNFQKYQENLKALGLDTVLEMQTTALERYNNRVK